MVLDVQGVGYDVFLPQFVMRSIAEQPDGETLELEIYYHVTDRQIRPTLIGFNNVVEKRFFEKFISVEDIGPQKAARAMVFSVSVIARAIEAGDVAVLRKLPGIGERTANKVVATLRGKVTEEALLRDQKFAAPPVAEPEVGEPSELRDEGIAVLTTLGYRHGEAVAKVEAALKRNPALASTEDLIREVYRGEREAPPPGTAA